MRLIVRREPAINLYGVGGTRHSPLSREGPDDKPFVAAITIQDVTFKYSPFTLGLP